MLRNDKDIEVLALTIFGEARGEYDHPMGGLASLIAVGNVVMNRLNRKTWYGKTIAEVCKKPYQFSCWNPDDPNYSLLQKQDFPLNARLFLCREVAEKVASGTWPDLTKGSTHYHSILGPDPRWAESQVMRMQIGRHMFYKILQKV